MNQVCPFDFQDLCCLKRAVEHEIRALVVVRDNFKTNSKSALLLDTNIDVFKRLQLSLSCMISDYGSNSK